MKFKFKEFTIGLVLGVFMFSGVGSIADAVYDIMPNPYKIKVNGEEVNIEGYNINGYSYFKLRDIGEQTGFNVDFKEETILIDTENTELSNTSQATNEASEGVKYITPGELILTDILKNTYLTFLDYTEGDTEMNIALVKRSDDTVLLENIPYVIIEGASHISEEYLYDVLVPIDESLNEE